MTDQCLSSFPPHKHPCINEPFYPIITSSDFAKLRVSSGIHHSQHARRDTIITATITRTTALTTITTTNATTEHPTSTSSQDRHQQTPQQVAHRHTKHLAFSVPSSH
ncbi:hypothetical protein E2C01_096148 [Portunus trituberculatus]|uniref:Uncharacterized protein n=1 Tax=Portunus trituberculatus TaxID=210409 RepID=A0A5B7K134_PORTR|nr:hypothetical protein [Portunus trituberculatus]